MRYQVVRFVVPVEDEPSGDRAETWLQQRLRCEQLMGTLHLARMADDAEPVDTDAG